MTSPARRLLGAVGIIGLVSAAAAPAALAGPWTPARGHGQVIVTGTFYDTRESFDERRRRVTYDFGGTFEKRELNPYVELGLTDRLALLGNLFVSRQAFTNDFDALASTGLGDTEVGLRYRVSNDRARVIYGVQGMFKLPTSKTSGDIALGNHQFDAEVRGTVGGSLGGGPHPPFWNVDAGYRFRKEGPADEVRVDAAMGVYVHPRVMLMGQFAGITGMKNNDQRVDAANNPILTPDYDLYRLQGSVVVRVSSRLRIQAGGFGHVAGRNTGAGGGALLSGWWEF